MAKLRTYQTIENDTYQMLFTNEAVDVSQSDKDLIEKFGEPEVNFGGVFDDDNGVSFTLPNLYVKIISGLPYKVIADPTVTPWSANTTTTLALYRTTIQTRFQETLANLRESADNFTNEYIVVI